MCPAVGDTISYLDYNASTPVLAEVASAVSAAIGRYGNPSSVHAAGRRARAAIEEAREAVAAMVKARPQDIVFTSGATESNALALRGLAHKGVLASAVEHPSILAHNPEVIAVDGDGVIDLGALELILQQRKAPMLVALMFANNETGALQPITQAVEIARKYGALVHCDAVQAPGKIALDMGALGVDSVALSAHKFGGLKGAGALVLRPGLDLVPDILGGGQERRRRAGTENVTGIVGFGAAAVAVPRLLAQAARISGLRAMLETGLRAAAPNARIYAETRPRLPNTTCLALPGVASETQLMRLDLAGIAVSAGSACSSGKIAPSHVLLAMGVAPDEAKSAIRVSFGWENGENDVSRFLAAWQPLASSAAA